MKVQQVLGVFLGQAKGGHALVETVHSKGSDATFLLHDGRVFNFVGMQLQQGLGSFLGKAEGVHALVEIVGLQGSNTTFFIISKWRRSGYCGRFGFQFFVEFARRNGQEFVGLVLGQPKGSHALLAALEGHTTAVQGGSGSVLSWHAFHVILGFIVGVNVEKWLCGFLGKAKGMHLVVLAAAHHGASA